MDEVNDVFAGYGGGHRHGRTTRAEAEPHAAARSGSDVKSPHVHGPSCCSTAICYLAPYGEIKILRDHSVPEERTMENHMDRITIDPEQCGGRPCVRGTRIRVIDILDMLATGLSREEIVLEMPDLELEDITAALQCASRRLGHPVLAA